MEGNIISTPNVKSSGFIVSTGSGSTGHLKTMRDISIESLELISGGLGVSLKKLSDT